MTDRADRDRHDAHLIGLVIAHDDHDAFAELVRRHQSAVRQFLRRLTANDTARADDLAQETFWRAYRHLSTFEGRGRFVSWLFRIAFQQFVNDRRTQRPAAPLPDNLPAHADEAARAIGRRTVEQLMSRLGPEERAAIVLHYQHGMSHAEIADALEMPLGTVKTLIRRGRLAMGAAIERSRNTDD
ncbi:MAG: RNA polymerase sigma factor [Vicinamibacterales bacterium]